MSKKIQIDDLANEITSIMNEYVGVVDSCVAEEVVTVGTLTAKKIKESKPAGAEKYGPWNEYLKGWTSKNETKRKKSKAVVHNKTHYRLAHLLEKGHALKGGGRTRAFPHIAPAEEWAEEELMKRIKRGV